MKRANRLMLVIGVARAALSFLAALALGGANQQRQEPPQIQDVPVVVAADIALGAQIGAHQRASVTKPETDTTTGITLRELVDQYGVLPPQPVTAS